MTRSAETDASSLIPEIKPVEVKPVAPAGRRLPPFSPLLRTREAHQRFWAFIDQGVVSLGNFMATVMLARALKPGEFGIFALLFGSILFLNTVHAALVTYPLSIFGAPMT